MEPINPSRWIDPYRVMNTLQNMESIGALPAISLRIFRTLESPESSLNDVARIVMQDQAICAQILKIANSVYYSRGRTINTVSQAITHLGTEVIKRILFSIELISIYPSNFQAAIFEQEQFWRHTLAGALVTQQLAQHSRLPDTESFYLAALLRNLGVLVIRQFFPDAFRDICRCVQQNSCSFEDAEDRIIGLRHRAIAYLVAVRWGLPREILYTYQDELGDVGRMKQIHDLVLYADALLAEQNYALWDRYAVISAPAGLKEELGISDELQMHVLDACLTEVNELSTVLAANP